MPSGLCWDPASTACSAGRGARFSACSISAVRSGCPGAAGWIRFLATSKYPASLQFLLMTLGPTLVALGALDGARNRFTGWLAVYGRVPLFFYLLHIPLIHLVAVMIAAIRTPAAIDWLLGNHPVNPGDLPPGYAWSLPLVYVVTLIVVAALYVPCKWYSRVRAEARWGWTTYI